MTTGDQTDFVSRIKGLLPQGWFPVTGETDTASATPVLDALISGSAAQFAAIWTQQQYVTAQTRIATATGIQLDIIALDYLGPTFLRRDTDTDATFRARILAQLLAPRGTRAAIVHAIQTLCGTIPKIVEPAYAYDTGGWDVPSALAWDTAGCWATKDMPFEIFVTVIYNASVGVPDVGGWDTSVGGWDQGAMAWVDDSLVADTISFDDIYATVAACMPIASIAWVQINPA